MVNLESLFANFALCLPHTAAKLKSWRLPHCLAEHRGFRQGPQHPEGQPVRRTSERLHTPKPETLKAHLLLLEAVHRCTREQD